MTAFAHTQYSRIRKAIRFQGYTGRGQRVMLQSNWNWCVWVWVMGKPNPAKNARKHMLAHMREKQAKERAQVRAAANVRLKSGPPQTQSQAASAAWPKPAKRNPYTKKRLAALAADVLPIWREGAQEIVGLFDWWDNIGQAKFEREHKARAKRLKRRLV